MTLISNINYEFDLSVEEKIIETEDETSQKHTVAHLLNTLSPRQREIIYYRFFEGLDYSSICELMGLNYQSAHNLLARSSPACVKCMATFFFSILIPCFSAGNRNSIKKLFFTE